MINFRGFGYPRKFFNDENFPDYGILVFFVFLHATLYHGMCISIFQQFTKMYDMLNKNSQGLLKKGAAKQSRIKSIVKL